MKYLKLFEELQRNDDDDRGFRHQEINRINKLTLHKDRDEVINSVYEIIQRDCKPFLEELKSQNIGRNQHSTFLFRFADNHNYISLKTTRKDRRPKDTSVRVHNLVDTIFMENFGVKPRSEAVFATNDVNYYSDYNINLFFPIGEYKYFYHENVSDLFPFMVASGVVSSHSNEQKQLKKFMEENNIDLKLEDIATANMILKRPLNTITSYDQFRGTLIQKGFITEEDLDKKLRVDKSIKIHDWAKETLRTFLEPLIKEYKSEGVLDCPNDTEVMFICDNYYLIQDFPFTEELYDRIFNDN